MMAGQLIVRPPKQLVGVELLSKDVVPPMVMWALSEIAVEHSVFTSVWCSIPHFFI
jgi:hypothetical protein